VIEGDFQAPNWLDLQRLHHNPFAGPRIGSPVWPGDCDRLTGAQTAQEKIDIRLFEKAWLHIYKLSYDKLAY
jgi:hypothetical protein